MMECSTKGVLPGLSANTDGKFPKTVSNWDCCSGVNFIGSEVLIDLGNSSTTNLSGTRTVR